MSRGFPSMTALLGLLAVAGYQNRDKLGELLGGLQNRAGQGGMGQGGADPSGMGQPGTSQGGGLGGLLGGLTGQGGGFGGGQGGGLGGLGGLLGGLGGAGVGGLLSGGLSDLLERFNQSGHGQTAQSWVQPGPNQPIAPDQLEQAIGPDVLSTLTQQTGLSREELLARLSRELPEAVDKYTPEGQLPQG
ncbi:YidB family protein [Alsobacter sp. SYSU BS001988]|jgi:uncharacterized protein YidB (DUF937 family)